MVVSYLECHRIDTVCFFRVSEFYLDRFTNLALANISMINSFVQSFNT